MQPKQKIYPVPFSCANNSNLDQQNNSIINTCRLYGKIFMSANQPKSRKQSSRDLAKIENIPRTKPLIFPQYNSDFSHSFAEYCWMQISCTHTTRNVSNFRAFPYFLKVGTREGLGQVHCLHSMRQPAKSIKILSLFISVTSRLILTPQ